MNISLKADEKLLFSLRELYRLYGYRSFRMSKFEKYELYAGNKDFLVSDRVITFNDTNGELLALKPDVTLSIVRNASFVPGCKQKLYYHENVYRPAGSSRQFREIMQCGLECIGDLDNYDVYEVLHLAAESLGTISEQSVLSVSHLGILKSLFTCLGAGEREQSEMLKLTAARNEHELAELFRMEGWDQNRLRDLRALMGLSCSLGQLPESLESLNLDWLDTSVRQELKELSELCEAEDDRLCFDLSVINDIHYYNGIVFQGFVQGIAEKVISGGRYDSLLRRMDRKGSAIGFAVYLGILDQLLHTSEIYDADVLLLYDEDTSLRLVRDTVRQLQCSGRSVSTQRRPDTGRYGETIDLRGGEKDA